MFCILKKKKYALHVLQKLIQIVNKNNSGINMENSTGSDYNHAKRTCRDFKLKNLGEYHDLHLKSDTILLVDVFENFEIYELDHARKQKRTCYNTNKYQLENKVVNFLIYYFHGTNYI